MTSAYGAEVLVMIRELAPGVKVPTTRSLVALNADNQKLLGVKERC